MPLICISVLSRFIVDCGPPPPARCCSQSAARTRAADRSSARTPERMSKRPAADDAEVGPPRPAADDSDDADVGPPRPAEEDVGPPRPEDSTGAPTQKKRKAALEFEQLYLENLPVSEMYEKSYMHRDVVTDLLVTPNEFIITASCDGQVWPEHLPSRRCSLTVHTDAHACRPGKVLEEGSWDVRIREALPLTRRRGYGNVGERRRFVPGHGVRAGPVAENVRHCKLRHDQHGEAAV